MSNNIQTSEVNGGYLAQVVDDCTKGEVLASGVNWVVRWEDRRQPGHRRLIGTSRKATAMAIAVHEGGCVFKSGDTAHWMSKRF